MKKQAALSVLGASVFQRPLGWMTPSHVSELSVLCFAGLRCSIVLVMRRRYLKYKPPLFFFFVFNLFARCQSLSPKGSSGGSLKWRHAASDLFVSFAPALGMDVLRENDKSAKILLAEPVCEYVLVCVCVCALSWAELSWGTLVLLHLITLLLLLLDFSKQVVLGAFYSKVCFQNLRRWRIWWLASCRSSG